MQSEFHYASIIENSQDAIISKDLGGHILTWNAAAERIFGWTADEMIGESISRLLPPGREDEEEHILGRIAAGEQVGQFYTERVHKEGRHVPIAVSISPILDFSGNVIGASKIARDVSDVLADKANLQETQARFRLLADNISQLTWIARADGHIFWYNKRWHDYTGASHEEMDGWGWQKVHHPDHIDRVLAHFSASIDAGVEWEDIFPLRRADGAYRWFLSRAKPIRDSHGKVILWFGSNTDVTAQREQEEQIRTLLQEVNHRSKNTLALIQAIARRSAPSDSSFVRSFEGRIAGLAVNQDILIKREWQSVPLDILIERQLEFLRQGEGQFQISGPDLTVKPTSIEMLGLALHELGTNSLKYGALSIREGQVSINWSLRDDGQTFHLEWRERNGPAVTPPQRRGFGSVLIEDIPGRTAGAHVTHLFEESGVIWSFTCPIGAVLESTLA
ncbi:PAS domain S-box protein [Altererythrobacter confluentis]|uniref:histidine kinase n=1 Tax=Allopontixanthobacter confluentis TaxID=1849021 RepID=A0A6L7GEZ8_9SPHN|nr:PAS domain S-box protein [Allopontixanthobacter confluentis]MXP14477.1 PAS domain S-box protein [Allopontixanthobacter confluentis]